MQRNNKADNQKIILVGLILIVLTAVLLLMKLAPNAPWPTMPWWGVFAPLIVPTVIGSMIIVINMIQAILDFWHAVENKER